MATMTHFTNPSISDDEVQVIKIVIDGITYTEIPITDDDEGDKPQGHSNRLG